MSLLSCRDIFVCRTCLCHNCSVVEKLELKTGEDVLEEVEKFCYLGDMISCFGGAFEAVSARIGSAWKKFRELSGVLVEKQGLSLMQRGKIYQCCVRPVLSYCFETWELTVADEMRLRGVERRMIRMMCGVRLVDRVSTDVLWDKVGVVVTIKCSIIQRRLRWYGHVIRRDISSQIREVMEHEIPGKRKKGRPRKSCEKCVKKDLERYDLRREDAYDRVKWREHIKAKITNPASRDNGIKTDVVVVVVSYIKSFKIFFSDNNSEVINKNQIVDSNEKSGKNVYWFAILISFLI